MRMIPRHQMIYPQLVFWNSLHSRLAARFPSGNLLHVTPQCFPVDSRVLKLIKLLFPFLFHLTQFCFVKSFVQFFLNKCKLYSINNIKQHWFWSSNQTSLSLAFSWYESNKQPTLKQWPTPTLPLPTLPLPLNRTHHLLPTLPTLLLPLSRPHHLLPTPPRILITQLHPQIH